MACIGCVQLGTFIILVTTLAGLSSGSKCGETVPPVAVTTDSTEIQEAIDEMNKYRVNHGVGCLTKNDELCKIAQAVANKDAETGTYNSLTDKLKCTANVLPITGSVTSLTLAVTTWYGHGDKYTYTKETSVEGDRNIHTEVFTALMWKASKETCIAKAKATDGNVYIVALFAPAGNVLNQYKANVLPEKTGTGTGGSVCTVCGKTTVTPVAVSTSTEIEKAIEEMNKYRTSHGVGTLTKNDELCKIAQAVANKDAEAGKQEILITEPKCSENYHENKGSGVKDFKLTAAVTAWYDQGAGYVYTKETNAEADRQTNTERFTALMWKASSETCIAMAKSKAGDAVFVVAFFNPAGNVFKEYIANVLKKTDTGGGTGGGTGGSSGGADVVRDSVCGKTTLKDIPRKTDDDVYKTFTQDFLVATNKYRKLHKGVGELKIKEELCSIAQAWAEKQAETRNLALPTPDKDNWKCGYNLFKGIGTYTAMKVVGDWYAQEGNYDYTKNEANQTATSHYTALIWKATTETCAVAVKDSAGNTYVVAMYLPKGNDKNFKDNVLKPTPPKISGSENLCLSSLVIVVAIMGLT